MDINATRRASITRIPHATPEATAFDTAQSPVSRRSGAANTEQERSSVEGRSQLVPPAPARVQREASAGAAQEFDYDQVLADARNLLASYNREPDTSIEDVLRDARKTFDEIHRHLAALQTIKSENIQDVPKELLLEIGRLLPPEVLRNFAGAVPSAYNAIMSNDNLAKVMRLQQNLLSSDRTLQDARTQRDAHRTTMKATPSKPFAELQPHLQELKRLNELFKAAVLAFSRAVKLMDQELKAQSASRTG